jgi:glycosyltransferase involved in cell wall biosynthesis
MLSAAEKKHPVKVSVILPTYNQSTFLPSAIQTILTQTHDDFELIIVNDGSTDQTEQLLATLKHPKLRVITQHNQGLPSALNTGFSEAKGEYWTWTSTDNLVAPTWLEELVKALDNSPPEVSYAFSHYAVIDENGKILYIHREQRFDLPTMLMRHSGNASFLYRSELAKKVGPYDTVLNYAEDLDMWIRMAEHTRAIHVESTLYYYRQHNDSMTTQKEKVRNATQGVVNKFLAKTGGQFDIDRLFPSIQLSADPALERWKARIWLATLGANATYYCPVDALVDQLVKALNEKYERSLVANIAHLYAKEQRWETAAQIIAIYRQTDPSDFLTQLADIVANKANNELQKIPYVTLEEKFLATDCKGPWSQTQLLRNLSVNMSSSEGKILSFDKLAINLVNQLEDQQDHPEVWQNIAALQSAEEKKTLHNLRLYLSELISVPQDPTALVLLKIVEAVCFAYSCDVELAKNKLQQLSLQYPNLPVLKGALFYITHDEQFALRAAIPSI